MKKLLYFFFFLILTSCESDDLGNTRAYVEGKISTKNLNLQDLAISIKSENKVVAQTVPTTSGNFVLSGPLFSNGFTIHFNQKIKSFSASKPNLVLASDSLSINIPENVSHLVFSEITMQK